MTREEIRTQGVKVTFNKLPTSFEKETIKAVRPWCFVNGHAFYNESTSSSRIGAASISRSLIGVIRFARSKSIVGKDVVPIRFLKELQRRPALLS
jgi:hypothetical protein